MTSIHESSNRDSSSDLRALALECYVAAIANMAEYAVELDEATTAPHRRYLSVLAAEVKEGQPPALLESRSTLRGLLRDYRDRAAQHLGNLREQLAATAQALQETVEALSNSDGDYTARIRTIVDRLRELARTAESDALRAAVADAAQSIEESLVEMRQQHQFAISQLQTEIRVLHARVDSLENAAAIDEATKFSSRRSIEEYIQSLGAGACQILLCKLHGLAQARAKFSSAIADDLVANFARRLRNSVPKEAVVGRWSEQDFLALLPASLSEEAIQPKSIAYHLSMPYACLSGGKTIRIPMEVSVEPLATAPADSPDRVLQRLQAAFSTGEPRLGQA
jgi:GGDEF domain-containing protein